MSDAIRTNRMRCRVAVVSCSLLSFLVFLAVCDQLLSTPDAIVQEVGWKSYHMFTILSPMTSYYRMMLYSNNILFHTINPIIAILLFIFINSDHKVSFRSTFLAIAPVVLYAALYFVLVFVIGEENGGWRDHYQIRDITQYVPLPLVVLGMVLIAFAVALLLRAAHNRVHKKRKKQTVSYYQSAGEFDCPGIASAIGALAARNRSRDPGGELTVPRRILGMMEEKYKSGLPLGELCRMYIDAYYENEGKEQ